MITYVNTKTSTSLFGAVAAMALALSAAPAVAGNARTWISGKGVDQAGCGPIASPCRTMQYAHDNTNAGGEIDVLDSAGYGMVTITKSISVVGDGVIAGLLASAGQNAVTINAGASDTIVLRGLTIEGSGVGKTGILLTSGGTLDVSNCVVRNFGGQGGVGIAVLNDGTTCSNVPLTDTTLSSNNFAGLLFQGQGASSKVQIVADHVIASGNGQYGFSFVLLPGSTIAVSANVTDSLLSFNGSSGVQVTGNVTVNVDHARAESNVQDGLGVSAWGNAAGPLGAIVVGRSVVSGNGHAGLDNNGGTIRSYGDNRIVGNGTPTVGTITTIAPL